MHDCYGKVNDMLEIVIVILLQKMVKRMDKKKHYLNGAIFSMDKACWGPSEEQSACMPNTHISTNLK